MLENHVVVYRHVSGSLVCDMHIMSLLYQTDEGTAHGDDVIVRMR